MRHLRRKLTLRAHGDQVVLVRRKQERIEHVWMKAFLWALYRPDHPDLSIEVDVDDKYKPDVVAIDPRRDRPQFWGEAGAVGPDKIGHLVIRYPHTRLAFAKWAQSLAPLRETVTAAAQAADRAAPIHLLGFPPDSAERFIDDRGHLSPTLEDLEHAQINDTP